MKLARLALLLATPLALTACTGGEPAPTLSAPEATTPAATVAPEPSGESTSEPAPSPSESPTPFPVEPSVVESMNTEKAWDDWGVDDPLPPPGPENSLVQLIRMDFTDPEAIDAHVRLGLPEAVLNPPGGEEITFCEEGDADADAIGFGGNWSVARSERDGYVLCDTTGTFPLSEWGDDALLQKPTLEDGVWTVDFQQSFIPEQTVALYRFRMEFGGPVLEASEGGVVDGTAVTWNGPAGIRAVAESGE